MATPFDSIVKRAAAKLPPKNQARPTSPSGSASRPSVSAADGNSVPMQSIPLYEEARSLGVKNYNISDAIQDYKQGVRAGGAPASFPAAAPQQKSTGGGTSSSSRGGYSYGGGGGGGGAAAAALQKQQRDSLHSSTLLSAKSMLDLMNSSAYQFTPDDAARGRVNSAVDTDLAASNGANDELVRRLTALQGTNPYASLQAQAPQMAPQLSALIQSQGGNAGAYEGEVGSLNQLAQLMAGNWNGVYRGQQANQTASDQSQMAQAAMGRSQNAAELAAQRSALLGIVDQNDGRKKDALTQQKLQIAQQLQALFANANAQASQLGETDMYAGPTLEQMGLV